MSQLSPRRRGSVALYAVAFALVLASAWAQFRGNIHSSLKLVWASIALSGLALGLAVVSVLIPTDALGRRRRDGAAR